MKKLGIYFLVFIFLSLVYCNHNAHAHHNPSFGFAGTAGPITTNPASTIKKGHWAFGLRAEYLKFDTFLNRKLKNFARKRDFIHSGTYFLSPAFGASYGLTDDLTLSLRLPVNVQGSIRDGILNKSGNPTINKLGTAGGLGDLTIFAQYRFLNLKQKALEAAILTGVDIPTGITKVKDLNGDLFGPDHQPGAGSFDPLVGLSVTKLITPKLSFDTNYLYTIAVKGIKDFDAGDLHNYNAALSYRLLDFHKHSHNHTHDNGHIHKHSHKSGRFHAHIHMHSHPHKHSWYSAFALDGIIELNGEWRQKQVFQADNVDKHSGGSLLYVSPGFRIVYKDFASFLSVGIPALRDLNGEQGKPDIRLIFGFGYSL
ncbi:MAG: transporter [Candidatus Melainabacteria bacterium]|nr:transporter [Candidatus Melainabacteria bacterium]